VLESGLRDRQDRDAARGHGAVFGDELEPLALAFWSPGVHVQPFEECLLWVTQSGIWASSENLHLFYRVRESLRRTAAS
jgi:hypothetical protein